MRNVGIFIGRMCPIHKGHMKIIQQMIDDNGISNSLVFIGSAASHLKLRVMFNYGDRRRWIKRLFPDLRIMGIPDFPESDVIWMNMVDDAVNSVFRYNPKCDDPINITFYGGSTEDVEFFYDAGKQVKIVDRNELPVSASMIRLLLLQGESTENWIDNRIRSEVEDLFKKRIKQIDKLR